MVTFPRALPDIQFTRFDLDLQEFVSQADSGGRLTNMIEYASPRWSLTCETRGLQERDAMSPNGLMMVEGVKAWWASLRGGLRSVLVRHPAYSCPLGNIGNPAPAQQAGTLAAVTNGNVLSITGLHAGLALGAGDYVSFKWKDYRALALIVEASGTGAVRTIEIEPYLPGYIEVGATVYFDRAELIMRPVIDSFQIGDRPLRQVSFQLQESVK